MRTIDVINQSFGANSVFHAAQGTQRHWQARSDKRSQRYTTSWEELARVW